MSGQKIPVGLFHLGRIVSTPGALQCLAQIDIIMSIQRHQAGDWGDLCEEDRHQNDIALERGGRLVSVYHSSAGLKFYVITEADRSVTTILLPEEY